jgi:predicted  nucleic acid-binding Zn-ribbon protein
MGELEMTEIRNRDELNQALDQAESVRRILDGVYEILLGVLDDVEDFECDETATAIRQAITYTGVARQKWGRQE